MKNPLLAQVKDRITNMLSTQTQKTPWQNFTTDLGDIGSSYLSSLSQGTGAAGVQQGYQQRQQFRQVEAGQQLQNQKDLYSILQEEAKKGDQNAVAVDKAIKDITGNDIKAYNQIASKIHALPEEVNASNANLHAIKIASQMGYKPLSRQKDELELEGERAKLGLTKAQTNYYNQRGEGGSDSAMSTAIKGIMQANPDMSYPQALYLYQTGFRTGTHLDDSGNVVNTGGYLDTRTSTKAAEAKGAVVGKTEGNLAGKSVSAPEVMNLISQAYKILPQASSGRVSNIKTRVLSEAGRSTKQSEADAKLDVIAAGLTLNVPRMEGPQGVLDLQLYEKAAANVGKRNLPYKTREASLKQLEALTKKYIKNTNQSNIDYKSTYGLE